MIMIIVISMLIVMSVHTIAVFCSKPKRDGKQNTLAMTPQGNTPCPRGTKPMIVDREDRDSIRTKAGNRRGLKDSKEPDSTDDAFKDLAARLAKKEKPDKTADSLLAGDDENPLAQFQMPERPVVEPNQDGAKLENIVEMQKRPASKPTAKALTPSSTVNPVTAKENSIANVVTLQSLKKSKMENSPIAVDKTQSDPHDNVDLTQNATMEEIPDANKGVSLVSAF